ncbi:MAG: preprotein translocase subunit YajC [Clostridia bacterium]|nr:preprotein translocase subunit YajC [Clostridia bacterium]
MDNIVSLILLSVVLVAMFAFMLVQGRKQKKAQDDYMAMLDSLRPGVKVKMASGLLGRIKDIHEVAPGFKTITLNIGEDKNVVEMTFVIEAVQGIVNEEAINRLNMEKATAEAKAEAFVENKAEDNNDTVTPVEEVPAEVKVDGEVVETVNASPKKSTRKRK